MDIDCNMFPILDDPEGAGGTNKHIGTHRALMGQVIDANDGCFLAEVMTLCWEKILQNDKSFLEDPKGLALVFWCTYGKQRSTAVAAVLRYCMERSGWNLYGNANTFGSKPEITLLSHDVYEKFSCGRHKCHQCDDLITCRTGCDLQTAYDIWCDIATNVMNKRGRRHRT